MIHPSKFINQHIKGYYCPIELIKRSESAFTFKAIDERSRKTIILKYFLKHPQNQIQDLIQKVVRDQAAFRSSSLITPLDFGTHKAGGVWCVFEKQESPSLLDYCKERGGLTVDQTAKVLYEICKILEPLHEQQHLHGNLRPSQIFLGPQKSMTGLKVGGYGGFELYGVHKLDRKRITFGDPAFFTYEQAAGKTKTLQTDFAALGLIGYFLITNRFPFSGASIDKVLTQIMISGGKVKLATEDFAHEAFGVEADKLCSIIIQCVEKSPQKRPASLETLKKHLLPVAQASSTIVETSLSPFFEQAFSSPLMTMPYQAITPEMIEEHTLSKGGSSHTESSESDAQQDDPFALTFEEQMRSQNHPATLAGGMGTSSTSLTPPYIPSDSNSLQTSSSSSLDNAVDLSNEIETQNEFDALLAQFSYDLGMTEESTSTPVDPAHTIVIPANEKSGIQTLMNLSALALDEDDMTQELKSSSLSPHRSPSPLLPDPIQPEPHTQSFELDQAEHDELTSISKLEDFDRSAVDEEESTSITSLADLEGKKQRNPLYEHTYDLPFDQPSFSDQSMDESLYDFNFSETPAIQSSASQDLNPQTGLTGSDTIRGPQPDDFHKHLGLSLDEMSSFVDQLHSSSPQESAPVSSPSLFEENLFDPLNSDELFDFQLNSKEDVNPVFRSQPLSNDLDETSTFVVKSPPSPEETYMEMTSVSSLFPDIPAWNSLVQLRDDPDALRHALLEIPLPISGYLLPFSQFQLQIEGRQFEEGFIQTPLPQTPLPDLEQMVARLTSKKHQSQLKPQKTSSASKESATSAASAVHISELNMHSPALPEEEKKGLPLSVVIGTLLVVFTGGIIGFGFDLESVKILFGSPEYSVESPVSSSLTKQKPKTKRPNRLRKNSLPGSLPQLQDPLVSKEESKSSASPKLTSFPVINLKSDPPHLQVWFNEQNLGTTPTVYEFKTSTPITLLFKKEGYQQQSILLDPKIFKTGDFYPIRLVKAKESKNSKTYKKSKMKSLQKAKANKVKTQDESKKHQKQGDENRKIRSQVKTKMKAKTKSKIKSKKKRRRKKKKESLKNPFDDF